MSKKACLIIALFMSLFAACKKEKADETPEGSDAKINTVELASSVAASVYGSDITFKVKFDGIGSGNKAVDQYGILFIAWKSDADDKTPVHGNSAIILIPDTPVAGTVIEKNVTLTYEQFNDANYRAFARLKDGTYVYGEVLYFVKA